MRCLIFGSRNLTWKHLDVMLLVASHAIRDTDESLASWMKTATDVDEEVNRFAWGQPLLTDKSKAILLNGDGPPGSSVRGAIGADKLAVFACMQRWPEGRRGMRWFPPEPKDGETWAQAAGRRNAEMVAAKPDRAYCVHENLDASKGSSMTAKMLTDAGIRFHLATVSQAGAVLKVEER